MAVSGAQPVKFPVTGGAPVQISVDRGDGWSKTNDLESQMQITPINEAEAIISPFWDGAFDESSHWTVDPGTAHGLVVRQNWCWLTFEWARRPAVGPALRMRRVCGVDCDNYDQLVLSVMAPKNAVVRIVAETNCGVRRFEAPPAGVWKKELVLDLGGATRIEAVILEVEPGSDGIEQGWFNWLGLQHSRRLARMLKSSTAWSAQWEKHLKDESFEPEFKPSYGLVLNARELHALRRRHEALTAGDKPSPFVAAGLAAQATPPESMIHEFVNLWDDSRYNRERDHGKFILIHGLNAAIAGHLLQDKRLLRLAARYAMSIGMCGRWDDGFICRFPGGTFNHVCFVQSLCAYEVAGILDLAGEYFTDLGRDFLLRRLAEEAIGAIQYNTWNKDYIFHCNQLSWFTPGRMLALGVLNRHWPRVRPYLDIAYRELCESLDHTVLPDGGYLEGPTYFRCVGRDAGLGVYHYSRAIGESMETLIPQAMKRCGDFAEVVESADLAQDVVPFCDAVPLHDLISQAIMAGLLPDSAWARMLRKTLARAAGWPVDPLYDPEAPPPNMLDNCIAWGLAERMASVPSEPQPFVALPDMGPMTSHRRLGGHWVKLFIQGNHAGAGHTHEDKGSFVLQFGDDTFAMDPGTCGYSLPLAGVLHNCERHNMLVPYGVAERPAPQCPLMHDVKPKGCGDATVFHAEIDATPGWDNYYLRWHRNWDSPTPDTLTITDEYELASGEGVEFYWQTCLPVALDGDRATITGKNGCVVLQAPTGCVWRVDELPLPKGLQHRLAFSQRGKSGRLTVLVSLSQQ